MKKRFRVVLLAGLMTCVIVMSMAFTGCGLKKIPDFVMPEGGYDGSEVEITFANTTGQKLAEVVDAALVEFNKLYPNIKVKVDNSNKNYDTLESKIGTQLTTGKQPNVAFCYSDHVAFYNESNAVLPLNDFFLPGSEYESMTVTNTAGTEPLGLTKEQVADYVEPFYAEGSVYGDGKIYTLPFAKSTEVLYYNKTYFDANNLTVPTTWAEMEQTCQKILDLAKENEPVYPLGYDSEANLFITLCEQYESPYTSATGEHFLFNNEKNKTFVRMLCDWYKKKYFTTKETYGSYTSYLFTSEKFPKCYMSIGSTGGSSYQDPGSSDNVAKFEVGVAPLPQADVTKPKSILQGPSVCIFKNDDPQKVLASWLLVKFLTTDIEFQGRYSETSGYMPVTYSAFNSEAYQEFLKEGDSASGLTARTAATCKKLVDDEAFYTSPAFTGSSKARERVGILMKDVLEGGDIDKAFATAITECKNFVG